MVSKMARILKKYFISYRVPRKGALAEDLASLNEEEATSTPTPARAPDTSTSSTDRDTAALLKDFFDEVAVHPEVSGKTLKTIQKEHEELINAHNRADDNTKARVKGLKLLILKQATAGMMQEEKDKQLIIDLNEVKKNHLDEGMLRMFGAWIEYFLNGLFGGWMPPVSVRGSQKDVEAFARALDGEKRYIDTAKRYGLDHPTTYKNKSKLNNAVKGFEKETGIKWPFK